MKTIRYPKTLLGCFLLTLLAGSFSLYRFNQPSPTLPRQAVKSRAATGKTLTGGSLDSALIRQVTNALDRQLFAFRPITANRFAITNEALSLKGSVTGTGISLNELEANGPDDRFQTRLTLKAISVGSHALAASRVAKPVSISSDTLQFRHTGFTVEYVHNRKGLRQNFIIERLPEGVSDHQLQIRMAVSGDLQLQQQGANDFLLKGSGTTAGRVLRYHDLRAWDATGKALTATMEAQGQELVIRADLSAAAYPVTIDPILTGVADQTSFGGQASALMGYSVAPAGDVDGDGYGDVIVGVRGYNSDQGAAFLYKGSPNGLLTGSAIQLFMPAGLGTSVWFGASVSSAGDVNGDGYSDLIIGAPRVGTNAGITGPGAIFIYYGSPAFSAATAPATTIIQPASQNGSFFGVRVALAGDLNGDGFSDVAVGANTYFNAGNREGGVFVYYGTAAGISNATPFTVLTEGQTDAEFGWAVASAGDVDGDGLDDLVVGAHRWDNGLLDEGRLFLYYGDAANPLTARPRLSIRSADPQQSADFANSVAGAGDVDGDGYSDVIAGAYLFDIRDPFTNALQIQDAGAFYLYRGGPGGLSTVPSLKKYGTQNFGELGWALASAGDVDQDGYADVAVAEYERDQTPPKVLGNGKVHIFNGSAAGLSAVPSQVLTNGAALSNYGYSLSSAGDVNGDGISDLLVGSPNFTNTLNQEGSWNLYYGQGPGFTPVAAQEIHRLEGLSNLGYCVASAQDLNNDGYTDLIAGAPGYNSNRGRAYIFFGKKGGFTTQAAPASPAAATVPDIILPGPAGVNSFFGASVASGGDVDGNGYPDILVGAYGYLGTGAVFVYYNYNTGLDIANPQILTQAQAGAQFGFSVASAGDMNSDGVSDIVIGAPGTDFSFTDEGSAHIFFGKAAAPLAAVRDVQLYGGANSAFMGRSVTGIGDFDGDGYSDVAVGTPGFAANSGSVSVVFGDPSGTGPTVSFQRLLASIQFGSTVAAAGDIDGNGLGDFMVTEPNFSSGSSNQGAVAIYYGNAARTISSGNPPAELLGGSLNGQVGLGNSCASATDVNGDGYSDILVGARNFSLPSGDKGIVRLYYGGPTGISPVITNILTPAQNNSWFGTSVATIGDVNGDGYGDFVIGAPDWTFSAPSPASTTAGNIFVYYGGDRKAVQTRNLRLYDSDLSGPIENLNIVDPYYQLTAYGRSFLGRNSMKLAWETQPNGLGFAVRGGTISRSALLTGESTTYTLGTLAGAGLTGKVTKRPNAAITNKVRARIKFNPARAITGYIYGPIQYLPEYVTGQSGSSNQANVHLKNISLPIRLVSFTGTLKDCREATLE
ncbi:MAG TPA: FG-GAP-like repeat-containing protein, partial [Flavisolibacter sp.]|nr:FG-GAP-like repeat-containing protein [Flavisolibacter sp.]